MTKMRNLLLATLLQIHPLAVASPGSTTAEVPIESVRAMVGSSALEQVQIVKLPHVHTLGLLEDFATYCRDLPTYRVPWVMLSLVDAAQRDEPNVTDLPLDEWQWDGHGLDLNTVRGRAAWILEQAWDMQLNGLPADELGDSCAVQAHAFISGMKKALAESDSATPLEAIRDGYRGRIRQRENDAEGRLRLSDLETFEELLTDFAPLGKDLEALENIVGVRAIAAEEALSDRASSADVTGVFHYAFIGPLSGKGVSFVVKEGRIVYVN